MAEAPGYGCYLSAEAVAFVLGLPKPKQRKVVDLIDRIRASPEQIGDYQTTDAKGRPIEHLLLEEFLFTYWIDHASKEVQITEILGV